MTELTNRAEITFAKQALTRSQLSLFPVVSQVTTAKSLGVTIDDRLDWSGHIEKVTKKVASGIGARGGVLPNMGYIGMCGPKG